MTFNISPPITCLSYLFYSKHLQFFFFFFGENSVDLLQSPNQMIQLCIMSQSVSNLTTDLSLYNLRFLSPGIYYHNHYEGEQKSTENTTYLLFYELEENNPFLYLSSLYKNFTWSQDYSILINIFIMYFYIF